MVQTSSDQFVKHLTGSQARLLGYITSLVPDLHAAQEILQDTNLVLWQKAGQFTEGTAFLAWACAIARNKVRSYYRDLGRDKHVFDGAVLDDLATEAEHQCAQAAPLSIYLDECLSHCTKEERSLLAERYDGEVTVTQMAKVRGLARTALAMRLSRLRAALMQCIERKLAAEKAR